MIRVGSFIVWTQVHVVPSCSDVVVVDSNTSPSNLCGFKKLSESTQITIERVPRDVMHAHVVASPSSAEELRELLTELNAYRDGEAKV